MESRPLFSCNGVFVSVAPYSSSLLAFSPFPLLLGPGLPFGSTVLFIILTVKHLHWNPLLTNTCGISETRLRVAVTDTSLAQTMMILFGIWSTEVNFLSGSQDLKAWCPVRNGLLVDLARVMGIRYQGHRYKSKVAESSTKE